jgi:hypothetical protein
MIALRLWSKLRMFGRYSLLAGSIYKSKLNYFVFYNLKPVKLHVACITEQYVTQDRTLDKGTKDKFNNKLRYYTKIQRMQISCTWRRKPEITQIT